MQENSTKSNCKVCKKEFISVLKHISRAEKCKASYSESELQALKEKSKADKRQYLKTYKKEKKDDISSQNSNYYQENKPVIRKRQNDYKHENK